MKVLKCCVLLLAFSCMVFAEEKPALKVVRVTGTAEVKAVPDRAVIELGVEKESPSASQAKSEDRTKNKSQALRICLAF